VSFNADGFVKRSMQAFGHSHCRAAYRQYASFFGLASLDAQTVYKPSECGVIGVLAWYES
jgi:hypothetical protein